MTQALQLLTVVAVGIALACYGLFEDRREHRTQNPDPRQSTLFPTHRSSQDHELVAR
jgi:hypothetical protein